MALVKFEGYLRTTADDDTDANIRRAVLDNISVLLEKIRTNPPLSEKRIQTIKNISEERGKNDYVGPRNTSGGYPKIDWQVTCDVIEK